MQFLKATLSLILKVPLKRRTRLLLLEASVFRFTKHPGLQFSQGSQEGKEKHYQTAPISHIIVTTSHK